jgi:hypothetical protein
MTEKITGVLSDYYVVEDKSPERNCITLPNGDCIGGLMAGKEACIHDTLSMPDEPRKEKP